MLIKGLAFPLSFSDGHLKRSVTNSSKIKDDLSQLVTTLLGERLMRPIYGIDGGRMLFRKMDSVSVIALRSSIQEAVAIYEQRISLEKVSMSVLDEKLRVTLQYAIKSSSVSETLEVEV